MSAKITITATDHGDQYQVQIEADNQDSAKGELGIINLIAELVQENIQDIIASVQQTLAQYYFLLSLGVIDEDGNPIEQTDQYPN